MDKTGLPILCDKKTSRCTGCKKRCEGLPRYRNREDYVRKHSIRDILSEDGTVIIPDIPDNGDSV